MSISSRMNVRDVQGDTTKIQRKAIQQVAAKGRLKKVKAKSKSTDEDWHWGRMVVTILLGLGFVLWYMT